MPSEPSPRIDVGRTFRQNTILLIGGTGFIGKVTLALLLDRYPDLKGLYLMVRPVGDLSGEDRFYHETVSSPALAPTYQRWGHDFFREKVRIVEGDVSRPLCGLSRDDQNALRGAVDVIINAAGLVDFSPPLDESLATNVYGVQNLMDLATHLGARIVHVSTCFVSRDPAGFIRENIPLIGYYPDRTDPSDTRFRWKDEVRQCEQLIESVRRAARPESTTAGDVSPDKEPEAGSPRWVRSQLIQVGRAHAARWGWVNTYTYTKSLGEQIIASQTAVPYTIVRPAIVETALRFPFPGWNEGFRTTAPLILMAAAGVKSWPVRTDAPLEIVPVDLVSAGILIATAALLNDRHAEVYQLATADTNPVLLTRLVAFLGTYERVLFKHKTDGSKLLNWARAHVETHVVTVERLQSRRALVKTGLRIAQAAVSAATDVVERLHLPGKTSLEAWGKGLRSLARQVALQEQTLDQYLPFMVHNRFIFEAGHIRATYAQLTDDDQARLPWDPEKIDWADYWVNKHIKGFEKWIRPVVMKAMKAADPSPAGARAAAGRAPSP